MQIQPDYSHQLEEIAKALNRSSIPQWVVALIAALVGAFLGMAGQWLMKVIDNRREIYKMRRVLYLDLLTMFEWVDPLMDDPDPWLEEQLGTFLKFDGEAYLKGHQDIYMQLPERRAADWLYADYHRILDDKKPRQRSSAGANYMLALSVEKNDLQRKYIKKFLGSAKAEKLLEKLHALYEDGPIHLGSTDGK